MTQRIDNVELQTALALSQAACYASMSAKEHREGSPQAAAMLALTQKLTDMTLASLDASIMTIEPKPGEPTLEDYVNQAKAAHEAGQPIPEVVLDIPLPEAGPKPEPEISLQPAPAPTFIPAPENQIDDAPVTLAGEDYKPLPIPPAPVPLPSGFDVASAADPVGSVVDPAPLP